MKRTGLVLFESGAILLHIARKSDVLMPADAKEQARTTAWMFAALNSIEPQVQDADGIDLFHAEEDWAKARRAGALKELQDAARRAVRLARWPRLSGEPVHRR